MIYYLQPLFAPCSVMFVLSLVMASMGEAVAPRSVTYAGACRMLALAMFFDVVVCVSNVLLPHIPANLLSDHAVLFIPLLPIETSLVSMAALMLFHRSRYFKLVLRFGIFPAVGLMLAACIVSLFQYFADAQPTPGMASPADSKPGSVMFDIVIVYFAATIVLNFSVLISSMLRFRRQINSYFAYRERVNSYVLLFGTGLYCLYLLVMFGCILFYFGVPMMSVFSVSLTLIHVKTVFFVLVVCMLIRFHRRYYLMEPSIFALDEIDEKVENPDAKEGLTYDETGNRADGLPLQTPDAAEAAVQPVDGGNTASGLPDEAPSVKYRLEQWVENEKKYFLRDDMNLLKVAEMIDVSPRLLSGYLNTIKGINFNVYINQLRIDEAQRLIRNNPDKTLTEIAYITGYSSVAIFSRSFKRITGITPTQYRQNCAGGNASVNTDETAKEGAENSDL